MLDAILSLFRIELTTDSVLLETKWIVPLIVIVVGLLIKKVKGLKK